MTNYQIKTLRRKLIQDKILKENQLIELSDQEVVDHISKNYCVFGLDYIKIPTSEFEEDIVDRKYYETYIWHTGSFMLIPKKEMIKLMDKNVVDFILKEEGENKEYKFKKSYGLGR